MNVRRSTPEEETFLHDAYREFMAKIASVADKVPVAGSVSAEQAPLAKIKERAYLAAQTLAAGLCNDSESMDEAHQIFFGLGQGLGSPIGHQDDDEIPALIECVRLGLVDGIDEAAPTRRPDA